MLRRSARSSLALAVVLLSACTSSKPVNMSEPRRLVATENDVRIDVEVTGEELSSSTQIPIRYEITNNRSRPIAFADLIPEGTYDQDSQIVTVALGSEVPGEEFLPRLILISPGSKKSFSTIARVNFPFTGSVRSPLIKVPNALQVRLNFLGDPKPFEKLIGISERAVHDPQLAAELFPKWIEGNETLLTNSLPMHWVARSGDTQVDMPVPSRRRRGPPGVP